MVHPLYCHLGNGRWLDVAAEGIAWIAAVLCFCCFLKMNIDRKKRELKGQKQEEQEKARKEKDVA